MYKTTCTKPHVNQRSAITLFASAQRTVAFVFPIPTSRHKVRPRRLRLPSTVTDRAGRVLFGTIAHNNTQLFRGRRVQGSPRAPSPDWARLALPYRYFSRLCPLGVSCGFPFCLGAVVPVRLVQLCSGTVCYGMYEAW